jgi:3-hydroxyisobutyrate dehydrogenase
MKLAFVGLGGMGSGMVFRLLNAGFPVTVYNRTAAKAEPLVSAGARWAATPEAAADDADVILLSLSDESAVDEVLFGRLLPVLKPGVIVADTTTTSSEYAVSAAERLAADDVRRVELCVLGNPAMARSGELRLFAAGDQRDVVEMEDVLKALGHDVDYLGPPGMACAMKLSFNLLLGVQVVGLAEALAFGIRAGIDRKTLIGAIANSGVCSPVMAFRAEFMRTRGYLPAAFRARLMAKDLRLAVSDAAERGLPLPVTARAAERMDDVMAAGRGDEDAAVIAEIAEYAELEATRPAT